MSKGDVGYKKPPKKAQFKKGESGNPTGRPKGSQNLETILDKALAETVTITDKNGIRNEVSKLEALLIQWVNKAISDPKAFKHIIQVIMQVKKKELVEGVKEPLPWFDED